MRVMFTAAQAAQKFSTAAGAHLFVAAYDPDRKAVLISSLVPTGTDPGHVHQLWLIPADGKPRSLGFVLQNGGLLPFLNIRDNINLPRRLAGLGSQSDFVDNAISALRLEPLLDKLPQALSIGERQRAACVRAIAHQPGLILADEPTAALDPHNARLLFELLLRLVEQSGLCALIVSHDWELVRSFDLPRLIAVSRPGETHFEASR